MRQRDSSGVLLESKGPVEEARRQELVELSVGEGGVRDALRMGWDKAQPLHQEGLKANPPRELTGRRRRPKRGKAGSLVDRLREHKSLP